MKTIAIDIRDLSTLLQYVDAFPYPSDMAARDRAWRTLRDVKPGDTIQVIERSTVGENGKCDE